MRAWIDHRIRSGGDAPVDLYADLLQTIEPPAFEEVMRRVQGNRWLAAKWLGLNRATVRKKLAAYNLADLFKNQKDTDDEDA